MLMNTSLKNTTPSTKKHIHKLNLNFHIHNNFNVMTPNLKALNLSGLNIKKISSFKWPTENKFDSINRIKLRKQSSLVDLKREERAKPAKAKEEERYQPKSFVIEDYETRVKFYDDDISPLIGYLLLAFSVICFLTGMYCFLGELIYPSYVI